MGLVRRGINLDNKKFFEHFKELNYRILISLFIVSIFFTIVAALLITTEAMVADQPEPKEAAPAAPGGMDGMGGMGGMGF